MYVKIKKTTAFDLKDNSNQAFLDEASIAFQALPGFRGFFSFRNENTGEFFWCSLFNDEWTSRDSGSREREIALAMEADAFLNSGEVGGDAVVYDERPVIRQDSAPLSLYIVIAEYSDLEQDVEPGTILADHALPKFNQTTAFRGFFAFRPDRDRSRLITITLLSTRDDALRAHECVKRVLEEDCGSSKLRVVREASGDVVSASELERVGVLLVHGIGDQNRYDHLQSVADQVIRTLCATHGDQSVSVAMPGIGNVPLSAVVKLNQHKSVRFDLHEMWWQDLRQRGTAAAILRFWWWAASLAGTNGFFADAPEGYMNPHSKSAQRKRVGFLNRVTLFFKTTYFFVLLAPIALVISFTHFIPGIRRIRFVESVFTHLSSVQLYQEKRSYQRGTLVDFNQSRRVSIQRRFADHLVTMAEIDYDRWYIAAHSLGSVIALKGLMYGGHGFAKLMTPTRWSHRGFKMRQQSMRECGVLGDEPNLPVWLSPGDSVDTAQLFRKLRGLITYGSPLETFANTWPAIVQLKRTVPLRSDFQWLNFYDPVDIIASKLSSFSFENEYGKTIEPLNLSAKASMLITAAHTRYWNRERRPERKQGLLSDVLAWIIKGHQFSSDCSDRPWFAPHKIWRARRLVAGLQWIGALFLGCLIWPFAAFGVVSATGFVVKRLVEGITFVLSYIFPNAERYATHELEGMTSWILAKLEQLKPTGALHLDFLNIIYIVLIFASVMSLLAIMRYFLETAPNGDVAKARSVKPVLTTDMSGVSTRTSAGASAPNQADA